MPEDLEAVLGYLPDDEFRSRLRDALTSQLENKVARPAGITYLHIPAHEPGRSARFYQAVFGWNLRGDPENPGFDDGTGHVIGAWVTDIPVAGEAGPLPYVFVDDVDDALDLVVGNGGAVVTAPYPEEALWVATFRDPAGNVVGVWQMGPRREGR